MPSGSSRGWRYDELAPGLQRAIRLALPTCVRPAEIGNRLPLTLIGVTPNELHTDDTPFRFWVATARVALAERPQRPMH